jgi:hypothetical protein
MGAGLVSELGRGGSRVVKWLTAGGAACIPCAECSVLALLGAVFNGGALPL